MTHHDTRRLTALRMTNASLSVIATAADATVKPRSRRGWQFGGKEFRKLNAIHAQRQAQEKATRERAERIAQSQRYAAWREAFSVPHSKAALADYLGDYATYLRAQEGAEYRQVWTDWLVSQNTHPQLTDTPADTPADTPST